MAKKDIRLAKGNSFYSGQKIYFVTKHGKEDILRPLFQSLGILCERVDVDTDQFGTFSGEIERSGSIRETLRKKIQAGMEAAPDARLILASEGSFGPDPFTGFLQTDLESLLLWDRELNIEIYAEHLSRDPVHAESTLGPKDDFRSFLKQIRFPDHRVLIRPEGSSTLIFKGLSSEADVERALLECFCHSQNGKVVIATDLRADQNKTRRTAIGRAGQALIEKMQSLCPNCSLPGFAITRGLPGLKCESCGEPSHVARAVLLECLKCAYTETKPRPDGKTVLSSAECEYCNP